MALHAETIVDLIEVLPQTRHLQVRRARVVLDGARELAREHQRVVYADGDDVTGEALAVQAYALLLWQPELIARVLAWARERAASDGASQGTVVL